jgi:hypothetical protein
MKDHEQLAGRRRLRLRLHGVCLEPVTRPMCTAFNLTAALTGSASLSAVASPATETSIMPGPMMCGSRSVHAAVEKADREELPPERSLFEAVVGGSVVRYVGAQYAGPAELRPNWVDRSATFTSPTRRPQAAKRAAPQRAARLWETVRARAARPA